jgi:hypothetical protein
MRCPISATFAAMRSRPISTLSLSTGLPPDEGWRTLDGRETAGETQLGCGLGGTQVVAGC